ncbi:MAG: hypothetical protein C4540_03005 [Candidatus Omnitrophota bacterium]|jgi:hypothetical protein|nr:MAG: hypothetical protein C4540_03005 [Candidatus Omnitrophota bacterium]
MKKLLGIFLVAVVLAGAAYYGYQELQKISISSLESITPDDVVYYLYSFDLGGKVKDFQSSELFKQVYTTSFYLNLIEPELSKIRKRVPFLPDFFQKDTAFVMYSLGKAAGYTKPGEVQLGDFLFLFRIDPNKQASIKKSVSDFYLSLAAKDQVSFEKHKGIRVTNYRLPKMNISVHYAVVSDVVMISNSIGLIQKSIDLAKNQAQASLSVNASFRKAKARIDKDALFWLYMSNRNYYKQVLPAYMVGASSSGKSPDSQSLVYFSKLKSIMDWVNILEDSVFYVQHDELKSGLFFKAYQVFNKPLSSDENAFKFLYFNQAVDKDTFLLIPRNAIGYFGGTQDMVSLWKGFQKFYGAMDEIAEAGIQAKGGFLGSRGAMPPVKISDLFQRLESALGVSIEKEVLPLAGNNLSVVLADIEEIEIPIPAKPGKASAQTALPQAQGFPMMLPRFYFTLELKDSVKMRQVMDKIISHVTANINQSIRQKEMLMKAAQQVQQGAQDAEGAQAQAQEAAVDYVITSTEAYSNTLITSVDIKDFPLVGLKFNYCIIGKYAVFSYSPALTKKVIDAYLKKGNSLMSNFEFESMQSRLPSSYSSIMFFDFKKLLDEVKETMLFRQLYLTLPEKTKAKNSFSQETVDSMLNILGNIGVFVSTTRSIDDVTVETSGYIKIKGL